MAIKRKETKFNGIDLNETNVEAIFNNCLPTSETQRKQGIILFRRDFGFKEDSAIIIFDEDKLNKYYPSISFLFGQLDAVKTPSTKVNPQNAFLKYDGTVWTKNSAVLMKFFHLGAASGILTPFDAQDKSAIILASTPTLSPKDTNFTEWFKSYQVFTRTAKG